MNPLYHWQVAELRIDGRTRAADYELRLVTHWKDDSYDYVQATDSVSFYIVNPNDEDRCTQIYSFRRNDLSYLLGPANALQWGRLAQLLGNRRARLSPSYINHFHTKYMEEFCTAAIEWIEELWPLCELCNLRCPNPNNEETHPECDRCGTYDSNYSDIRVGTQDYCEGDDYETICTTCHNTLSYCEYNNMYYATETGPHGLCDYCADQSGWRVCDECSAVGEDMYETGDGTYCPRCARQRGLVGHIHSWDHRPALVFWPTLPKDAKKPLYIGMELETSFIGNYRNPQVMKWIGSPEFKDLIFVKSDSSVYNGFEIVTHPMEPRWALKNFPFHRFDELINELNGISSHETCGTHIHMNKEAFETAHLWKFLQLHFRLPDFCKLVGGRDDGTYSSFTRGDMQMQRKAALQIAKAKGKTDHYYERYVAVNLRNEYTIELRYPAGGSDPHSIKKNMEWAQAAYDFTSYISVKDVRDGAINDPGYLLDWINEGDYPNLAKWVAKRTPTPKKLKKRSY